MAATAADAHPDNAALVRRRWQERSAAAEAMLRDGDAGGYFEDCAPDVLVSAPAMGYERQGIEGEARNIETGLAAGVRMRLTRVVACQGVTIVEADYDNPPDDPEHCPPWHTRDPHSSQRHDHAPGPPLWPTVHCVRGTVLRLIRIHVELGMPNPGRA